jgi:arylsulfatase A-like enzyme
MKSTSWEGGIRVPLIARWPGRVPAGLVSREICGVIDVFPTLCQLAGVPPPSDRVLDGRDIWPLMTQPGAKSPHDAIYSMSGSRLATVRSGKWKLYPRAPANTAGAGPGRGEWVDPRGPDGVTIIAPYEQAPPSQYPGVRTGDAPRPMMLFDLEADPAEQHDVAAQHPEVVERLRRMFEETEREAPKLEPRAPRPGPPPPKRPTGGELRYDRVPQRPEGSS